MKPSAGSWLVAGFVLLGCSSQAEPRAEWQITVSTDAPLPQLGDRLLIETLDQHGELACEGCRRVFSAASASDLPLSFSVVPSGQRLLLRTRLYRARITGGDGLPRTDQLIDDLAVLPETTTRSSLAVQLSLDCFGVRSDPQNERSCLPETGLLAALRELEAGEPLLPGSSQLSNSQACSSEPPEGMHCIPGGVFLRGDEAALSLRSATGSRPEQLVRLSPYFLDEGEVTVGQVRQLVKSARLKQAPARQGAANESSSSCTYLGPNDAANDAYPVNCLPLSLAQQACDALGKRLPTEAEWEYAAGNRDEETTFPWGRDPARSPNGASDASICEHALVSRASSTVSGLFGGDVSCFALGDYESLVSPVPGGYPLDVTQQGILNLAGNVAELVADAFASYTAPCWGSQRILDNPRCGESDVPSFPVSLRGSSWTGSLFTASAVARQGIREGTNGDPGTGFRCALDAE